MLAASSKRFASMSASNVSGESVSMRPTSENVQAPVGVEVPLGPLGVPLPLAF